MALIKCPECKKDISDKAEVCPNCGYELKSANGSVSNSNLDKVISGDNLKYLFIIVVAAIEIFLVFNMINKNSGMGYKSYTDSTLDITFNYPKNYDVKRDTSTNLLYVAKSIGNTVPDYPYIVISKIDGYAPYSFLSKAMDILSNLEDYKVITDITSEMMGNKSVYKIQISYTLDGQSIVDSSYAFNYNNLLYVVESMELNSQDAKIAKYVKEIIDSLK